MIADTNNILVRLVDADKKACALVDNAEEELDLTVANMEREIEEYKISYGEKAQKRIGIVRDTENKASEEASGGIAQRYVTLMQTLEVVYNDKHSVWEEELFDRCVGR